MINWLRRLTVIRVVWGFLVSPRLPICHLQNTLCAHELHLKGLGDSFIEIDGSGTRAGKDVPGLNELVLPREMWDVCEPLGTQLSWAKSRWHFPISFHTIIQTSCGRWWCYFWFPDMALHLRSMLSLLKWKFMLIETISLYYLYFMCTWLWPSFYCHIMNAFLMFPTGNSLS